MFSPRRLVLLALAATSAFAVTYQDISDDLAVVDQYILDLGGLADSYTGTGQQSLAINSKVTALINKLGSTKNDVNAVAAPTTAQAETILAYINNPIYPDTVSTLTKTKNKRTAFTNAGIKSSILKYLKDVKAATDALADALIARAPTTQIANDGAATKANFDAKFDDAIAYFT